MVYRYSATLAIVVVLITYGLSMLPFATRSQVVSGQTVNEDLHFEFTLNADSDHSYRVGPELKQYLEDNIKFYGEGAAQVVSSKVEITPKDVSWSENHTNYTFAGAGMAAQVQWNTPAASPAGTHGKVYLDFPLIPDLGPHTTAFHSGGYQKDSDGNYTVREVTTYPGAFAAALARVVFALEAGLPFGVLLHAICWAFVLKAEKRTRIAAFPPQSAALPQTYYPNPIAEWSTWLYVLGLGALFPSVIAGLSLSDGFVGSDAGMISYGVLAFGAVVALISLYFTGRHVLTVCIAPQGIAYARGRGNLNWLNANWSDILTVVEKSRTYRGTTRYWVEVTFADGRKKLKIPQSIVGYPALRSTLDNTYTASKQFDAGIAPYRG